MVTRERRVTIRSAIRGRERWQVDALRSRPRYAAAVERELSRHSVIRHAWANPSTGRLLVVYDPGVQRSEVHARVYTSLGIEPATRDECRDWRTSWPRGYNRWPDDIEVEQARLRMVLSGTLLSAVAAKRLLFGAGAFAGSPFFVTASAVLTVVSGYTALRRGLDVAGAATGISARTLLTAVTLGVLVGAESIDGIGALFAAHAGELLERKNVRASRQALHVLDTWWEPHETGPIAPPPAAPGEAFAAFQVGALLASGGALIATGDPQQSLAMLVGACPVAGPESRITARALSLGRAMGEGILFRHPEAVSSLPRRFIIVIDGASPADYEPALRAAGARGVIFLGDALGPEGKAGLIRHLRALTPRIVVMAVLRHSAREVLRTADVLLLKDEPQTAAAALTLMQRTSRIVRQDEWLSRATGVAGFTAATLGKLTVAGSSRLHNYVRLAMELNSLRLAWG
jgi:cation transport ATPase